MVITKDECWAMALQRQQLGSEVQRLRAAQRHLELEEVEVEEQVERLRAADLEATSLEVHTEVQEVKQLVAGETLELQAAWRTQEARVVERRAAEEALAEAQRYDARRAGWEVYKVGGQAQRGAGGVPRER